MALGQGKGQAKDAPAIYLAAFGKHPAWDDHIEDIGIETEFLAKVRRMLYTDAISGNIDSGAWEKLADDQRLAGFAHDFVWWLGPLGKDASRVVVGRLWSSRDGKGRTKYPMAVFAQSTGIAPAVMAREVLPALAALERRCIEATTADAVRAAIDQTREDLRSRFTRSQTPSADTPAEVLSPSDVASYVDREELGVRIGPVREGFARAMYAVEREMGAFLPLGGDSRKSKSLAVKAPDTKGAHIRLPALAPSSQDTALVWISLLSRRLTEGASILAIAPRNEGFVDVIVGDPGAAQLYGVRATLKGFPLTTDVPYVIDDAFRQKVAEMVARWTGATPPPPPPPPPAATPTRPPEKPAPQAAPEEAKPRKSIKGFLFGGSAVVVVGGITAAMLMRGNSGQEDKLHLAMEGPSLNQPAPSATPSAPSNSDAAGDALKREAAEKERLAQEQKARDEAAKDQAAKDLAAKEQAAKEQAAKEQQAREEADRDAKEKAQKEEAARVLAAKEEAARKETEDKQKAADQAAKEEAARKEADRKAQEQREADAARLLKEEKARKDEAAKIEAQKAEAEKARASLERDLSSAEALLADGLKLQDTAPGGKPLAKLIDDVRASPNFGLVAQSASAQTVLRQVAAIGQVEQSADMDFLSKTALSQEPSALAAAILAAERLADQGWPRDDAGWTSARSILESLGRGVARIKEPAHAASAQARMHAVSLGYWNHRWNAIPETDAAALSAAAASLETLGITAKELSPPAQYSLLAIRTREQAARSSPSQISAVAQAFIEQAGALPDLSAPAQSQVASVHAAMEASRQAAAQGPSLDQIGPGGLADGKKWKLESSGENWVVFAPPPGSKITGPVEFVRVHSAAGDAYVQVNEVSIGLFDGLIDSAGSWQDAAKLMKYEVKPQLSRQGPSAWEWEIAQGPTGIKPAAVTGRTTSKGWFDFDAYMAKTPYFDKGKEPESPSRDHPMQYVSPGAALYAARLAGCRLPTVDEMTQLAQLDTSGLANRRDASWMAANEFLARKGGGKNGKWFDGGIFVPSEVTPPAKREKAVAATESDDRSVLFWQVGTGKSEHAPRNTVGNVAEFVFEDAAGEVAMPADAQGLRDAVAKSTAVRVMGGSALSPPEVDPKVAYPVKPDGGGLGFSDVGFRLAFDAKGTPGGGAPSSAALAEALGGLRVVREGKP